MSPTLEALLKDLPPELQKEVEDFARYLLTKNPKRPRSKPTFGWAGALADLGKKYTAVELQDQALLRRQVRNTKSIKELCGFAKGIDTAVPRDDDRV